MARTRSPLSIRWKRRWEPTKPVPPVNRTMGQKYLFVRDLFLKKGTSLYICTLSKKYGNGEEFCSGTPMAGHVARCDARGRGTPYGRGEIGLRGHRANSGFPSHRPFGGGNDVEAFPIGRP